MRSYGKVSPRIWTGRLGRLMRGNPPLQTLVLYLATSPHQNIAGLYRLPIAYLEADTGLDDIESLYQLLEQSGVGYVQLDRKRELVWVVEHARHELGEKASAPQRTAVARVISDFADSPLARGFAEKYPELLPEGYPVDTLSDSVSMGSRPQKQLQKQEQEQEQEATDNNGAEPPAPPSLTPQQKYVEAAWVIFDGVQSPRPTAGLLGEWAKILNGNRDYVLDVLRELAPAGHLAKGHPYVFGVLRERKKAKPKRTDPLGGYEPGMRDALGRLLTESGEWIYDDEQPP